MNSSMPAVAALVLLCSSSSLTQSIAAKPIQVTIAQLPAIKSFAGRLITLNGVVRHADTAQVFTLGDQAEVHVVIPSPAIDAANVGDAVVITGFVRQFSVEAFERDYKWFRRAEYPDLSGGDWVIVATSVRTPSGTELVPPSVISNTTPAGKAP